MLEVTSFVGIPMWCTFPCYILVTWDLGIILVGILVGMVWVGSSRSGLWYVTGVKPVCMFWLQVGCL
jgi:hypothetical protein